MNLGTETRERACSAVKETGAVMPSMDLIRDLALRRPGVPVLSVCVRTDPRDPVNTAAVPGWLVELRNSLREMGREIDPRKSRERRMAFWELRERAEREVLALEPAGRASGWPGSGPRAALSITGWSGAGGAAQSCATDASSAASVAAGWRDTWPGPVSIRAPL